MKSFLKGLIIGCMIGTAGAAWAHHPAGGAGAGRSGPVVTIPAAGLQKGAWLTTVQAEYHALKPFPGDEMRRLAAAGENPHSIDSVFHGSLGIGHGLTDNLTVMLQLPYEHLAGIRESHADEPDEVHEHGSSKGIGDLTILGHYLLNADGDGAAGSALLFGVKTPTGVTNNRSNGERFATEHQPGSGSWDPLAGLAVSMPTDAFSLHASLLYGFATTGAQDTNLGDHFQYNAAASYRVPDMDRALDLVLELNGEWKEKQTITGVKDKDSGGNTVFCSPGIRLSAAQNATVFLSVGLPVLQDLNGIQNDTDYKALAGVGISF